MRVWIPASSAMALCHRVASTVNPVLNLLSLLITTTAIGFIGYGAWLCMWLALEELFPLVAAKQRVKPEYDERWLGI